MKLKRFIEMQEIEPNEIAKEGPSDIVSSFKTEFRGRKPDRMEAFGFYHRMRLEGHDGIDIFRILDEQIPNWDDNEFDKNAPKWKESKEDKSAGIPRYMKAHFSLHHGE